MSRLRTRAFSKSVPPVSRKWLLVGIGVAVEKGYQKGGRILREEGYHLESIAIIEEMDYETQSIRFREQPSQDLGNTQLCLKA
jgi:xanthine phosphoribosyltransferase